MGVLLAIGVWNAGLGSSDLVLVPRLSVTTTSDNCPNVENPDQQDFDLDSNVIEVFVGRLRKKLTPVNPIRTIRGQGYRYSMETTA